MASQQNDRPSREQRLSTEARFFQNPWTDTTQKVRNHLLLVSVVGILMAAVGIFPKEITALGLKIEDINQRAFLIIWAVVDAYFVTTFVFYAYSDFVRVYYGELFKRAELLGLPQDDFARELVLQKMKVKEQFREVHLLRLFLDVVVPLLSGVTAFGWLLWRSFTI